MEITCESCRSRLKVREEDIPPGKALFVTCPRCSTRQRVSPPNDAGRPPAIEPGNRAPGESPSPRSVPVLSDRGSGSFDETADLALILSADEAQATHINRILQDIGYRTVTASTPATAIDSLRLYPFDLVLMADPFDGAVACKNPVLDYLNSLSMSVRRHILLAVLTPGFKTKDPMGAFALSADLVIHPQDLPQLETWLTKGLSSKKRFYRVFLDTMAELGRT